MPLGSVCGKAARARFTSFAVRAHIRVCAARPREQVLQVSKCALFLSAHCVNLGRTTVAGPRALCASSHSGPRIKDVAGYYRAAAPRHIRGLVSKPSATKPRPRFLGSGDGPGRRLAREREAVLYPLSAPPSATEDALPL